MNNPVRIIPDTKYPEMYRLQWENEAVSIRYWDDKQLEPDGGPTSYGMFNKTCANDILKHYSQYIQYMDARQRFNSLDD